MIVHLTDDVVDRRYKDVATVEAAVAKYGGEIADYAEGDWFPGDRRDPQTGEFSRAVQQRPPRPITLSAGAFWVALDAALALDVAGPTVEEHVATAIAASPLDAATQRRALLLLRTAKEFHSDDPLIAPIGAQLGLDAAAVRALFEAAAAA